MLDPKMDKNAYQANMRALHEDRAIVEELSPIRSPQSTSRELLVPGGQAVLRFRKYLRQWKPAVGESTAESSGIPNAMWHSLFPLRSDAHLPTGRSMPCRW
jgi:hypothetical protein